MKHSLYVLPLALFLTAGYPTLSRADDTADECRKMAAEEEVAPEDMEDYIAECLAVVQSESPEEGGNGIEDNEDAGSGGPNEPDQGQTAGPVPTPLPAPAPAATPKR